MSFPPEVYLIGAQKAGTTTLACLLAQHPDICVAKNKEPHYFTANSGKSLAWYEQQFPERENTLCIDASTSYSFAPLSSDNSYTTIKCFHNIPQRIFSLNPQAKFIYLLRDPIARTYSGYWHSFNTGREHRSFFEAIKHDHFYLDVSDYYGQLSLWLEYFPLESFHFLLFEDMKQNPERAVKSCFEFLELDLEKIEINVAEHRNKTQNVNFIGRKFNRVFKQLDYSGLGFLAPSLIRNSIKKYTTTCNPKPASSEPERDFLRDYFSDKNQNLANLTGISLSQWTS
ncbi:MAG: sulfotransferase domain-containing protein [Cyanobacteria bacterium P01_G01_bin.19]